MLIVAEPDREAIAVKGRSFSKRVVDLCFLAGSALIVCALAVGSVSSIRVRVDIAIGIAQIDALLSPITGMRPTTLQRCLFVHHRDNLDLDH